jgi:hypothetical protein
MDNWIRNQCAASIRVIKEVKGIEYINNIISTVKLDNEKTRIIFEEKQKRNLKLVK